MMSKILNLFLILPHLVRSSDPIPSDLDPITLDSYSCDNHCNSLWGRVPLFNIPWTRGRRDKDDCVCGFNGIGLDQFMTYQCVQQSIWMPFRSKRKVAARGIQAQVGRMDARQRFEVFKAANGRRYASREEETRRFQIFQQNLATIDTLMAQPQGSVTFGVNAFSDYTSEEFNALIGAVKINPKRPEGSTSLRPRMLGGWTGSGSTSRSGRRKKNERSRSTSPRRVERHPSFEDRSGSLPPSWRPAPYETLHYYGREPEGPIVKDWRVPAHLYPPVESQTAHGRECGACWAFTTAAVVEILMARTQGRVTMLSKQALVDCVPENHGCESGDVEDALWYVQGTGVPKADDYPYQARTGVCRNTVQPYAKIAQFAPVRSNSLEAHLERSPLTTLMFFPPILQHYVSGVFDSPYCGINNIEDTNHAVVIVGHYRDAWILRNSAGSQWGLNGHFLVKKGRCGIGLSSFEVHTPYHVLRTPKRKFGS
ncbi:uncharacterized protein [Bemisia tabaci]